MIEQIFIISLICLSVHFITREGALFGIFQKVVLDEKENLRSELFNPLTECLACMSSFWTCFDFLMTDASVDHLKFSFLSMFFIILLSSVALGEKYAVIHKILYLTLIFAFICYNENAVFIFTVMMCVHGLNSILSKIIVFYDECQEIREMRNEDRADF